ncbi:cupredoxin domain-containing protein [Thermosporothrix hazakensis]|jgi:plastocyanin|nr:plastocyanin/azurin family copper-binding protein [Thermosporothrix hazakensis]BBH90880.1 hypothetical protein KTC_56310 [Thermosporothrix sp. COM3]GCE48931.1 hypothetical protein KTH_38000 [Thermosporothrix hazakensis]
MEINFDTMKKKFIAVLLCLSALSLLIVACGSNTSASSKPNQPTEPNTVHMSDLQFSPTTITIKKGESIKLVNDVVVTHIISNGTWDNGTAKPKQEAGAPKININVGANDTQTIGPFNTAGTFQLYCPIHVNMNLTVIVK